MPYRFFCSYLYFLISCHPFCTRDKALLTDLKFDRTGSRNPRSV